MIIIILSSLETSRRGKSDFMTGIPAGLVESVSRSLLGKEYIERRYLASIYLHANLSFPISEFIQFKQNRKRRKNPAQWLLLLSFGFRFKQ